MSEAASSLPLFLHDLLREARDTVRASTAEDGISTERRLYRQDLEARLSTVLEEPPVDEEEGFLVSYVESLRVGHVLREEDVRRMARVVLALKMGEKHHHQARSSGG